MSKAWEQFILIIVGVMFAVYAIGIFQGGSLEGVLLKVLIVGAALAILFTLIHALLSSVFRDAGRSQGPSSTSRYVDTTLDDDDDDADANTPGGPPLK